MAKAAAKRRIGLEDLRKSRGAAASVKGGGSKKISGDLPRKGTPPATPTPAPGSTPIPG